MEKETEDLGKLLGDAVTLFVTSGMTEEQFREILHSLMNTSYFKGYYDALENEIKEVRKLNINLNQ